MVKIPVGSPTLFLAKTLSMHNNIKKDLGNFEFLKGKYPDIERISKRLLSVEFKDMPFFRYAVLMASLLDDQFFPNALILGKAERQYDLTWLLKDFSTRLDFVSVDFSDFEIDTDLFREVNFIEIENIFSYKPDVKYDLIVLIQDYLQFLAQEQKYYDLLSGLISSGDSRIIMMLNYSTRGKEQLPSENIKLDLGLPSNMTNTFELKHYDKGELKVIDYIIDTRGIVLK